MVRAGPGRGRQASVLFYWFRPRDGSRSPQHTHLACLPGEGSGGEGRGGERGAALLALAIGTPVLPQRLAAHFWKQLLLKFSTKSESRQIAGQTTATFLLFLLRSGHLTPLLPDGITHPPPPLPPQSSSSISEVTRESWDRGR